ncbi:MAG: Gfo/Idh/MocA family oxidoreductase [Nitrospinae bacterium]|nr:Gfo/Idh/MocA family oxidoreductase [Nitrospinota bacterium]
MIIVGQLGCGYWGPNLLRNFSSRKDCRVKWVAEVSAERQAYVRENYPDTPVTPHFEEVLADPEVNAVVIATPAATHFALARAALQNGKHVLVEKPFTNSVSHAQELAALAAEKGLALMAGHTFIYNAAVRYVKNLVDSGELGDIFYIYCQRLNLGKVRSDVNAWWNFAPHDVSILLYLLNGSLPAAVTAVGSDYIQSGVEDVVFATYSWANKMTAHVHVSWLDPGKTRRITVVGSKKMVVYNDISDDKIAIYDKGVDRIPRLAQRMDFDHYNGYQLSQRTGDVILPKINFTEPLKVQAEHFLECIRDGKEPLTGARHAIPVVMALEAAQRALKTRQSVSIGHEHPDFSGPLAETSLSHIK